VRPLKSSRFSLAIVEGFLATYFMTNPKVCLHQLKRTLAVSYKTAWYLAIAFEGHAGNQSAQIARYSRNG